MRLAHYPQPAQLQQSAVMLAALVTVTVMPRARELDNNASQIAVYSCLF
jgi:hypothetical protein